MSPVAPDDKKICYIVIQAGSAIPHVCLHRSGRTNKKGTFWQKGLLVSFSSWRRGRCALVFRRTTLYVCMYGHHI